MNVIKYDIEIKKLKREYFFQFWRNKNDPNSVKQNIIKLFEEESDFEGIYQDALRNEWDNLDKQNIKNLNHSNFLVGYITVNNTKIFLFELDSTVITGKNNIAIQVYAFGPLPIENILNETFLKIKKVLNKLDSTLVNRSLIHIYPYNSGQQDIESTDLKIKANLNPVVKIKKTDVARWVLVIILSLICLVWSLSILETNPPSDIKSTLKSVFGSGIFYVLLDFIITIVVPYLTSQNKRTVTVDNLSSVLERTDEMDKLVKTEDLQIPQN